MKSFYFLLLTIPFFMCSQKNSETVSFKTAQETFQDRLSGAAILITHDRVTYDPNYIAIAYPNGDVPKDKGVCTDVIIRSYRKLGIDLQKEVHEDIEDHFSSYPNLE